MSSLLRAGIGGVLVALVLGVLTSAVIALFASVAIEGAPRKDVRVYAEEIAARAGAPSVVTHADLAAAGTGTPGEALLEWWQSMQLGTDIDVVVSSSFAPTVAPDRETLIRKLETLRYVFQQSKPRLIDSRVRGDEAQVIAVLASRGERDGEEQHVLEAFQLERIAGRWRVGREFVERRYGAEVAYARETEQAAER